jgi:hypothetical protein
MSPEELGFLTMTLPLHEVVTGMGKFPVPRDVVILAQYCCTPECSPDLVERLPQIFAVTGTMESRMQAALDQVIADAVQAFRRIGHTQNAADLEERNITHVRDIDTHLGRLRVDYRVHDGDQEARLPADALVRALSALRDISRHEAPPETFERLLNNMGLLMIYATAGMPPEQQKKRSWIAILDAWLSVSLAESRP